MLVYQRKKFDLYNQEKINELYKLKDYYARVNVDLHSSIK